MVEATGTAMDALAIDDFLEDQSTGVLAMRAGAGVYALPLSYAFDQGAAAFYYRLGYGEGSQKRTYVEAADAATFVVYGPTEEGWKSVVAEGSLESVAETAIDGSVVQAVERLHIPFYQLHRRPTSQLEFVMVRLDVEKLSGVAEAVRAT